MKINTAIISSLSALVICLIIIIAALMSESAHSSTNDEDELVKQAYMCAALFQHYGTSPNYTSDLFDAGLHLAQITDTYANDIGMGVNAQIEARTFADSQAHNVSKANEYFDPSMETFCIMIYRTIDTNTSGE
jgi:hypothetical protein